MIPLKWNMYEFELGLHLILVQAHKNGSGKLAVPSSDVHR